MLESIVILGLMAILLIGSPGPAAMALAAIGSSHKITQGMPLVLGLTTGALLTGLVTNAGMMEVLHRWPEARLAMQLIGGGFILVMAVRMIRQPINEGSCLGSPRIGYRAGILMNILNPKAYAVLMLLISKFMPPLSSKLLSFAILEAVILLACVIVSFGWLLFGWLLGQLISTPKGKQRLREVFALIMIICVLPAILSISSP